MLPFITHNLLWTAGFPIVITLICTAGLSYFVYPKLLWLIAALFLFSFYFFRNPERTCPEFANDNTILICPADGKVLDIQHDPASGIEGYAYKISIFLSPLDVHVNWLPCSGIIDAVHYKPGKFLLAWLPKSSLDNEHNDVLMSRADGATILVRQIAGFLARRIICWVKPEDHVSGGQKFGIIRFGSRVDILLPHEAELTVKVGERVYGGQTMLGRLPWRSV